MSTTPATTGAATADSTPAWPDTVDYVVIGAGAAGCVLASRLSEDPAVTVALVEIGPGVVDPALTVPANTLAFWSSGHDSVWPAPTTPQAHAAGRVVPLLTGRGVGGGSSVNAMGWFQGLPADYDGWAADGAQGWSWADMQPYFRRIEDHELGASTHHAAGGPMSITSPRHTHPLSMAFLAAGRHLGWPLSQDLNGAQRTGVALASSNIRDGARHSVVDGYLTPARGRDNLVVLHQTQVTRIEVDGNRAVGVHLRPAPAHGAPARTQFLSARRGVVLCAGAIRTPAAADAVGHRGCRRATRARHTGGNRSATGRPQPAGPPPCGADLVAARRRQPAGSVLPTARAVLRTGATRPLVLPRPSSGLPRRRRPHHRPTGATQHPPRSARRRRGRRHATHGGADGVLQVALVDPASRGTVTLTSSDPSDPVAVDPRYLAEPGDRARLRDGIRMTFDLFSTDALQQLAGDPLTPLNLDDNSIDAFLDTNLISYHHPVGTARIGGPDNAVVSPTLNVHGIDQLWVADASVMPTITRANTHAPTIAIAEHAADLVTRAKN